LTRNALNNLDDRDLIQSNTIGILLQNVAIANAAVQGTKAFEWLDFVNPYGRQIYQEQAVKTVPPNVAKTLLALSTEGKIPAWAIELIDMKLIRASATSLKQ